MDAARKQNGALSSRVSELEHQLADRDREIASLRSGTGDLKRQLAAAKQRTADLETQLAAMSGAAGDKDKLATELGAAKHGLRISIINWIKARAAWPRARRTS